MHMPKVSGRWLPWTAKRQLDVMRGNKPVAWWWRGTKNWGDSFNEDLVNSLTGRACVHRDDVFPTLQPRTFVCAGSILQHVHFKGASVWGAGFIDDSSPVPEALNHATFSAVRGPLTHRRLAEAGIKASPAYGDPGLLAPHLYGIKRSEEAKYSLALVPHYTAYWSRDVRRLSGHSDTILVDMQDDRRRVVERISQAAHVASSSLHGLVLADSLGIPSVWVEESALLGGHFKFNDYFLGTIQQPKTPLVLSETTKVDDLISAAEFRMDTFDADALMRCCPLLP